MVVYQVGRRKRKKQAGLQTEMRATIAPSIQLVDKYSSDGAPQTPRKG